MTPFRRDGRAPVKALEVLLIFLRLGLTSFGGPIAHIGYFREAFVTRRKWLDESEFADLVALCQFLPGPASSQAGFALGISRAGLLGGLAAWTGFTLPSAILLFAFAQAASSLRGVVAQAAIHGLKIVAVTVVAQAVWGMARTLTPDARRAAIAAIAALIVSFAAGSLAQIAAILIGASVGYFFCRQAIAAPVGHLSFPIKRRFGVAMLCVYGALLAALPLFAVQSHAAAVFDAFYRSGALVFGGGHVVLPLLRDAVVSKGWVSPDVFLAGYGAAQAVPGPLFTFSAFLGSVLNVPPDNLAGAALALIAIFLPGMLILLGALPFWDGFRKRMDAQAAMRGVNAAVVGILAAALYNPLWTAAILGWRDAVLALAGFSALAFLKAPPWTVVAGTVAAAVAFQLMR
ncbi:MAG: chromate efflux transporter [Proteobacteria bacterium]|nr:chromate efflux transporter [Pseudomonadota bacterium]